MDMRAQHATYCTVVLGSFPQRDPERSEGSSKCPHPSNTGMGGRGTRNDVASAGPEAE